MAKVVNFKNRITDLAGSLGTADDNAIEQWVLDGCYDIIEHVLARKSDDIQKLLQVLEQ